MREQRPYWGGTELIGARLEAARALLYDAANEVDHSPDDRRPASIAKLHTTDLAVRTTLLGGHGAGVRARCSNTRCWRSGAGDVYAFEFMDGTSNMLRLHTAPDVRPLELVS